MTDPNVRKQRFIEGAMAVASNKGAAGAALGILFPSLSKFLDTFVPTSDVGTFDKIYGISSKDTALDYFQMHPKKFAWGPIDVDLIVRSNKPEVALGILNEKIASDDFGDKALVRTKFLEVIQIAFELERIEVSGDWIGMLIQISPEFIRYSDQDKSGLFKHDNLDRMRWTIAAGFRKLTPQMRGVIFLESAISAEDISLACDLFRSLAGDLHPSGAQRKEPELSFGSEAQETIIRESLLKRIYSLRDERKLFDQADAISIIWFWWGSNEVEQVRAYLKGALENAGRDSGILIRSIVEKHLGTPGVFKRTWSYVLDVAQLELCCEYHINSKTEYASYAVQFLDWVRSAEDE